MARPYNSFNAINDLSLEGQVLRNADWLWNSEVQYEANDMVIGSNNHIYRCILTADGIDPVTHAMASQHWVLLDSTPGTTGYMREIDFNNLPADVTIDGMRLIFTANSPPMNADLNMNGVDWVRGRDYTITGGTGGHNMVTILLFPIEAGSGDYLVIST